MAFFKRFPRLLLPLILCLGFGLLMVHLYKNDKQIAEPDQNIGEQRATSPESHKAILFDLNGVLFSVNQQQALTHLGFLDVIAYTTVQGQKIHNLQDKVIEVLANMRPHFNSCHCRSKKEESLQPLIDGKPVPHVMRDWMQGELSAHEILEKALPYVNSLDEEKFFRSRQEKSLVKKTLQLLFDPKTRCMMYHPIKSGIQLVKQCKNEGHKLYLITNMDSEFMALLQTKHPHIFKLFDGMIISADVKAIKPNKDIYQKLLAQFQLKPEQCFLIDDQEENIMGAQHLGIVGTQCIDHDFVPVRKELKKRSLLA